MLYASYYQTRHLYKGFQTTIFYTPWTGTSSGKMSPSSNSRDTAMEDRFRSVSPYRINSQGTTANARAMNPTSVEAQGKPSLSYMICGSRHVFRQLWLGAEIGFETEDSRCRKRERRHPGCFAKAIEQLEPMTTVSMETIRVSSMHAYDLYRVD